MKINKKTHIERLLVLGILGIMLSSFVVAIGVGSGYTSKIPLEMYPGQERTIFVNLQNPDVEGGVNLAGEIIEGFEIASFDEEGPFNVPLGGSVDVDMTVEIPSSASIGQEYFIRYKFAQVSGEGEGGTTFSQVIERVIKVIIVEKPAEPATPAQPQEISNVWLWVLGIAVLIVIAWIILRKRKSNPIIVKKKK